MRPDQARNVAHNHSAVAASRTTEKPGRSDVLEALKALHGRGAHFVLCRPDKRPVSAAWQKHAPCWEQVQAWQGLVGVIPGSVGAVVLDVDEGGDDALKELPALAHALPVAVVPSQKSGRFHAWFKSPGGQVHNRKWRYGDVRGTEGFVVLWDAEPVAAALDKLHDADTPNLASLTVRADDRGAAALTGPDRVRATKQGKRNIVLNEEVLKESALFKLTDARRDQYRQAARESGLTASETNATIASASAKGDEEREARGYLTPWQQIAVHCTDRLRLRFRYDEDRATWLEWTGDRWVETVDEKRITDGLHNDRLRIAADLGEAGDTRLRDLLVKTGAWNAATSNKTLEWWAMLRKRLARPSPQPPAWELATPSGVVDLRDGSMVPHDPAVHDTLAVTRGDYRPDDAKHLDGTLVNLLRHNLSLEDYNQLMKTLGVAMARRNVDFAGVTWLYGASGGGKGFTADLLREALGTHAAEISPTFVQRRQSGSDIDADLAEVLLTDPILIVCAETTSVDVDRLNALTGGDGFSARKPYGAIVRGSLSGMVLCTSVNAPRAAVHTGLSRRLIVLAYPRNVQADPSIEKRRTYTADELDAVVTVGALWAQAIGEDWWTPPTGNADAKKRFEEEADPVATFLDSLADETAGTPMADVLASYNEGRAERDKITSTKLGLRVSAHPKWDKARNREQRMVLVLR